MPLLQRQRLWKADQSLWLQKTPRQPTRLNYFALFFVAGKTFIHADLKIAGLANPATLRRAPTNGFAAFVKSPELNARIAQIAASFRLPTKPLAGICRVEMQWGGIL
jgi:hypothetical protein